MMHPNPAFTSNPIFPGFPSMSGPTATSTSQHHSLPQSLPGTSAGNPYTNPMPGMSGGIDPAGGCLTFTSLFLIHVPGEGSSGMCQFEIGIHINHSCKEIKSSNN